MLMIQLVEFDLDVDAGGLARLVVIELIGREVDVGGQGQGAVLGQRGKAGKQEHRDDDQWNELLHFVYLHLYAEQPPFELPRLYIVMR